MLGVKLGVILLYDPCAAKPEARFTESNTVTLYAGRRRSEWVTSIIRTTVRPYMSSETFMQPMLPLTRTMHDSQLTYEDLEKKAVVRVALLPSNPVYSKSGEYQLNDITVQGIE
jgi:hypothetical protein